MNVLREAKQNVPADLLKFGTHVKKKVSIAKCLNINVYCSTYVKVLIIARALFCLIELILLLCCRSPNFMVLISERSLLMLLNLQRLSLLILMKSDFGGEALSICASRV